MGENSGSLQSTRRRGGGGGGGQKTGFCSQQCVFVIFSPLEHQTRHYTGLPVGALSSHCIFPVRNDVGSVVRDDVVVILSIRGKGLGGTGHLGL